MIAKFVVTDGTKKRINAVRAGGGFTSEAEALRHILQAGLNALKA